MPLAGFPLSNWLNIDKWILFIVNSPMFGSHCSQLTQLGFQGAGPGALADVVVAVGALAKQFKKDRRVCRKSVEGHSGSRPWVSLCRAN